MAAKCQSQLPADPMSDLRLRSDSHTIAVVLQGDSIRCREQRIAITGHA